MSNYRAVFHSDYDMFCLGVQEAIREGWTIKGDEIIVEGKYVQCFVRFGIEE